MARSVSQSGGPSRSFSTGATLVLDAVVEGYIRLIRRCPACRAWFAIRRPWQKFCLDECREKHFRKSSEGKLGVPGTCAGIALG